MLRASLGAGIGWLGISMMADGLPALLLPHQLLVSGGADATTLGVVTLVAIGVAAAIQPTAGRLADRLGRAPLMAAGVALAAGGMGVMLVPGLAPAGVAVALAGVSVAQAGYQPLLPDRIPARWRGRASGLKGAFDVLGASLGFVVLGGLLADGAPGPAVAILAVTLAVALAASRVLLGRAGQAPAHATGGGQVDGSFVRLVVARFLFLLGIYVVGRFLFLFIAERRGLGPDAAGGEAGAALAILALLTAAAALPSGWLVDRGGRRVLLIAGGALAGSGIALMPTAGSLELVVLYGALLALGTAAFGAASWAMLADLSASPRSGELLGVANLGTAGAAAAAGAFGVLIDAAGYGPAFLLAAACSVAGGLLAFRLEAAVRRAPDLIGQQQVAS